MWLAKINHSQSGQKFLNFFNLEFHLVAKLNDIFGASAAWEPWIIFFPSFWMLTLLEKDEDFLGCFFLCLKIFSLLDDLGEFGFNLLGTISVSSLQLALQKLFEFSLYLLTLVLHLEFIAFALQRINHFYNLWWQYIALLLFLSLQEVVQHFQLINLLNILF